MRFTIIAASLLVALATASPVADVENSAPLPDAETSELAQDAWFDCKGNGKCSSSAHFLRDCDRAVNSMLIRNDDLNYGASGSGLPDGAEHKHCKIYVAGPAKCKRSGNRMWRDYQDIRKHGCESCGSKHWGDHDHCRTTVNYVG